MNILGREARIFTVVDVVCGVAQGVRNFRELKQARLHAKQLREGRDLQEDDIQIFETAIDA